MKDKTVSNQFTARATMALLAAAALGAAAKDDPTGQDPREFNYLQLAGGASLSTSAKINVGLGSGVQVPGSARYDNGVLWNITLGHQFLRDEDENEKQKRQQSVKPGDPQKDVRQPMRVEVELWNANVRRNAIVLGAETVHAADKVKPRVLFLNAAIPVGESDELYTPKDPKRLPEPLWRTWLGAGVGYASQTYPSASAISRCNCLRQASGSGLAFQLKLQAERRVDDNTYLFGQIGRAWLPAVSTTEGAQRTEYARWGVNQVVVGVRWVFDN